MTKLSSLVSEPFATLVFVLLVSFGYGCTSIPEFGRPAQTASNARAEVDAVADKLEDTLTYVKFTLVPARLATQDVCNQFDPESTLCLRVLGYLDAAEQKVATAEEAIKVYREAGREFDAALKAVDEAIGQVRVLINLLDAVKRSVI